MAVSPSESLVIGGREFGSRLLVDTGKFSSNESMKETIRQQGDSLEIVKIVAGG